MPKWNDKNPNDITSDDVLVADKYHSDSQHKDEPAIPDEVREAVGEFMDDFNQDYLKNNGRLAFEASLKSAQKDLEKAGQPFDYDYTEKGVPLMPIPCTISMNDHGVEIPTPLNPAQIYNEDLEVAMVCFTPDFTPLYENDRSHLRLVKSTDVEFNSINDDNMPEQAKIFANTIKRIVRKWEEKHPPAGKKLISKFNTKIVDDNQYVLYEIAKFTNFNLTFLPKENQASKKQWIQHVDSKAAAVLNHYNVEFDKNNQMFVQAISSAIDKNLIDITNIKIKKTNKKCR